MDKSIEQLKLDIERHESALNRLKNALEMLTKGKVAIDGEECYLRQFCENDEVHRELVERLKEHDAYELYIEEHKKQREHYDNFGIDGKMYEIYCGIIYSGLLFANTSQGYNFWRNILLHK